MSQEEKQFPLTAPSAKGKILSFRIRPGCQECYVEIYVDNENLGTLVNKAFNTEIPEDDVLPWYGGDYSIAETVLGDEIRQRGAKAAILFACGCGQFGCSGVSVDVAVTDTTVTWSNFSTEHNRQQFVAVLELIIFDRAQFERALVQLKRDIDAWHPASASNAT